MGEQELLQLNLPGYLLVSGFSRKHLQRGGMCIFARKDLKVKKTVTLQNCKEKDLEICAAELNTEASKFIIISLYRAPTGDFSRFLKNLDETLKYLYKPNVEFLLCGDINTNYLIESNRKSQLSSLLTNYNLSPTVTFATRIQNKTCTAIDNIFVDISTLESSTISPLINALSDHDAQLLTINKIHTTTTKISSKRKTR
jgi:exonuclease III